MRRSGKKSVELLSLLLGPASGIWMALTVGWPRLGLVCLWRHEATQDLVPGFSPRRLLADQGPVLSRSRRQQHVGAQTGSRHPHPRHRLRHRLQGGCERQRLSGRRCLRGGDWRLGLKIISPSVNFWELNSKIQLRYHGIDKSQSM